VTTAHVAPVKLSSRVRADTEAPNTLGVAMRDDAIFFGSGVPDPRFHPADVMEQALDALLSVSTTESLNYCRGRGDATLRTLIAERSLREGVRTSADDVVITAGSSGAFTLLAYTLVEPGDVVLVEELSYPGVLAMFRQAGAELVPVALDQDGLVIESLEEVVTTLARRGATPKLLYAIANTQSPTTSRLADDRRSAIAALAERFGFLIVQDDTYGELWYEGEQPGSLRRYDTERTVHVGSFSKTVAPGLRLGWFTGPGAIAEVIANMRTDLGTSTLIQRMIASMMGDGYFDAHLERVAASYRGKRDLLLAALDEHCGDLVRCVEPPGGFFLWVTFDEPLAGNVERLAYEEGVAFLSGSYFDVRGGRVVPAFRLAFGELAEDDLFEGAVRLGRVMRRSVDEVVRS
jgi:2-aminoadipate transaminase